MGKMCALVVFLIHRQVSLVKAKEQLLIDFAAVVEENEKLSQKIDNIEQVFARTKVSQSYPTYVVATT